MRNRVTIYAIAAQPGEAGARRGDQKPAVLKHTLNRLIHISVEKANAEDLLGRSHQSNVERPTPNAQHQT
jgi:hypothetical protein